MPRLLRCLFWIIVGCCALATPSTAAGKVADTLVIGSISRNIKEDLETFQPLAEYLEPRLGAAGIRRVKIAVVTKPEEMVRRLQNGDIDIYVDSPFIVADIGRKSGATPFLRRWKKGMAEYRSLFVARKDSGIRSLDDLRGKVIAFDEPFSTSGYLLPKAMLIQRGYRVIEVTDAQMEVPADAIGYVFSMDDVNTMFWIDRRKAVAGVTSPDFFQKFEQKHKDKYVVFGHSIDIPRQVVAHRADLAAPIIAELERVLIGMEHDEDGRSALQKFQKTTRFDRFPAGAEATFAPIYDLLDVLSQELTN